MKSEEVKSEEVKREEHGMNVERPMREEAESPRYSREELELLIEKRLMRERKNNEQLQAVRELLAHLRKNPAFHSLSNAEIVARLFEAAAAIEASKDTALPDRADGRSGAHAQSAENVRDAFSDGNETKPQEEHEISALPAMPATPEMTATLSQTDMQSAPETVTARERQPLFEAGTDLDEGAKPEEGGERKSAEVSQPEPQPEPQPESEAEAKLRRRREIGEFIAKYGEDRLLSVFCDEAFRKFCFGKSGSPVELYEQYLGFLTALRAGDEVRFARAAESRLASTGFSGSSSSAVDYGSLLSESQKQLAQTAGLSYRRYAELLGQIPAKTRPGRG